MTVGSDAPRARPITLARRFAWASAVRLALLSILLGAVVLVSVRDPTAASYSVQVGMATLAFAFSLSAMYAWFLRVGRYLRGLVTVQLILDPVIWTVGVYLSGGVASGATSFYGVSCFIGALLGGYRGALIAAASSATCYAVLVTSLVRGWLMVPPDQPSSAYPMAVRDIVYSGVANALMLVAVVLLAGTLAERLRATGGQLLKAEARADRAEQDAELGRLAAGLAHEIRNPLGAISGSVALLGANPSLLDEERELCDIIRREADRLNDLVSDMLHLANPRPPELRALDVGAVAGEVVQLARNSGRGVLDVSIASECDAPLPILADEGKFRQMVWNLVRNAVQASKAGELVRVAARRQNGEIVLDVIDRGPGLGEEAKARIFDPFFTTRSEGTGVGLAVVKRIVEQHKWDIEVLDTPGGGATFRVHVGAPNTSKPPTGKPERWTLFPSSKA